MVAGKVGPIMQPLSLFFFHFSFIEKHLHTALVTFVKWEYIIYSSKHTTGEMLDFSFQSMQLKTFHG